MTLSWKLPDALHSAMVTSFPMTSTQTIMVASGITGLILPGMIDEPGCRLGSTISARPACGPEFIQRRSLAILYRAVARVFNWPLISTAASIADCAAK